MAQSEAAFQQECTMWFHNTYPDLRGLLFSVNNNSLSKREGAYNKALGLIAGVSDLVFIYGGHVYFIELKTPKGYQSPAQIAWQEKVEAQNVRYITINSIVKFKSLIEGITWQL